MKRYDTYTESGISWIGKVPSHWEMRKLRQLIELFSDKGHPNEQLLSVVRELGVVVRDVDSKEENHNYIPDDLSGYKRIRKGDFAINKMKAWQGSYAVSEHQGIVSPAYYTCHLRLKNKKFFNIAIRSQAYVPFFTQNSKGIRVGQWDLSPIGLKEIPFFVPPQEEQEEIVAYLDEKCAQIDRYMASLEERIERLGELRQALIAEAVTRGINPQAPLRPSGIPWLGEIPQHWEMKRLKYLFSERSEKGFPDEPILCSTQKYGVIPQSMYENRVVVVNKGLEGLKLVRKGDFVISLRSFQGGIEYAHYQGIISAAYTILQLNEGANSAYLRYLLKSEPFIQLLQVCVIGIREGQNINYSLLRKNFLPVPPQEEQEAIVAYLDEKTTQIDRYTGQLEEMIRQMKDLRQTIISEAVTGKICVLPN